MSAGLTTTSIFVDEVRLSQREGCATASKLAPAAVQIAYMGGSLSNKLWKKVSLGWDHSCATDTASTLHCWGRNQEGQVGDGGITDVSRPRPVLNLPSSVSSFSLGRFHTCAIASGSLFCWGAFSTTSSTINYGQAGVTGSLVASRINGISATILDVVCGKVHTCTLDFDRKVWCFGRNFYGQLGSGAGINTANPTLVPGIPHPVAHLASGMKGEASCVITVQKQRWCWGENNFGQLGDSTNVGRYEPVGGVSALVRIQPPGKFSGLFSIKNDMRLLIYGANSFGVSPYKLFLGVQLLAQSNSSVAFDLTCSWLDPSFVEGKCCCEHL
jgi:alpha-tubulin suppressor-like RCC1 family protein